MSDLDKKLEELADESAALPARQRDMFRAVRPLASAPSWLYRPLLGKTAGACMIRAENAAVAGLAL